MQGIIYVKVAIYLNADVSEEEAQVIVEDMDYKFKHVMIDHTEIQEVEEPLGILYPNENEEEMDEDDPIDEDELKTEFKKQLCEKKCLTSH